MGLGWQRREAQGLRLPLKRLLLDRQSQSGDEVVVDPGFERSEADMPVLAHPDLVVHELPSEGVGLGRLRKVEEASPEQGLQAVDNPSFP